jgi:hypothetical protein
MRSMIRLPLATVCIALELLMHGQGHPTDPLEEHGPFLLALAFASVSLYMRRILGLVVDEMATASGQTRTAPWNGGRYAVSTTQ